jgi:hypothetical protein
LQSSAYDLFSDGAGQAFRPRDEDGTVTAPCLIEYGTISWIGRVSQDA